MSTNGEKEFIVGLSEEDIEAIEGQDYTREERRVLETQYDNTLGQTVLRVGTIVPGKIIAANDKEVLVNIGYKSEGVIPRQEFRSDDDVSEGTKVDVFIEKLEDDDGRVSEIGRAHV